MSRARKQKHRGRVEPGRAEVSRILAEPRRPTDMQRGLADACLAYAQQELRQRRWQKAFEFAESAKVGNPEAAGGIMAEASGSEARRAALQGDFQAAQVWAHRAVELRPDNLQYRQRQRLIKTAAEAVLRDFGRSLFPDTDGPSTGHWWQQDLLHIVRTAEGGEPTVPAPMILRQTARPAVAGVYAVGVYQSWRVPGRVPLFTRYLKALKPGGGTIPLAAILLRQGLVTETDWIEEVDVVVPMATSLRSYEARGFELTEQLAAELAVRLALPMVDAFETTADAPPTHTLGGYDYRAKALAESLRLKAPNSPELRAASAALVVDDIVTYGTTFEACALNLKERYPQLRVYGAALGYTETVERRALAEAERVQLSLPDG